MASVTLATSEWIGFFKEAGIPAGPAVNYAVAFVDNRIQKNMLLDLNKEIMNELGITAVGDIIAILKHAKVVHRQDICKALTEPQSQSSMQADLRRNANSRLVRTSVFDRLGAESKADTTTGIKPTGVFSRLGDACKDESLAESDDDGSVLQYEGVLKKKPAPTVRERLTPGVTIKAKATSSETKPAVSTIRRLETKPPAGAPPRLSTTKSALAHRLGTVQQPEPEATKRKKAVVTPLAQRLGKKQAAAQDSKVSSTKPPAGSFKVTIKRTVGNTKVSSSSDGGSAQMDNTAIVSVFQRLGRKSE